MSRVIVAGSFNVDHVWKSQRLPLSGETLTGEYTTGPGGKGFNQAIAARRAGADVHFICSLGDDVSADIARSLAAEDEITLSAYQSKHPTGTAGIYVDDAGHNSIIIGAGANADLDSAYVRECLHAQAGDVVLVQLETTQAAVLAALQCAHDQHAHAILNPAPANARIEKDLLDAATLVTPNETEFCSLLKRFAHIEISPETLAQQSDQGLQELCRTLHAQATIIITLGSAGCFVSHPHAARWNDQTSAYRLKAEHANVKDTTGAGDAFNGALAASLALRGTEIDFIKHVQFANHYAARSTEQHGAALSMPYLSCN